MAFVYKGTGMISPLAFFKVNDIPGAKYGAPRGYGPHNGVDLYALVGTPLYSPLDAEVVKKYVTSRGGKQIVLNHPNGWQTGYAHLDDDTLVNVGDKLKKGDLFGYTGNTGGVAAHLHWTVRKDGSTVDPELIQLNKWSYKKKILKGALAVLLIVGLIVFFKSSKR